MTATTRRFSPVRVGGDRHAERRADRRARVADAEGVVLALGAARERREAALVLDRLQPVATAGQHLVRIGLVADVPDQAVVRRVEDVMQGDREFDRAEAGGEMAAHLADGLDQELAQLAGQRRRACVSGKLAQVRRRLDARKQRIEVGARHCEQFYTARGPGRPVNGSGSAASRTASASGLSCQPCAASCAAGLVMQFAHACPGGRAGRRSPGRWACRGLRRCPAACR